MRRILLLMLAVAAFSPPVRALDVPSLSGRVNDTARMLSPQTLAELEAALKAHEDSTSNQVVVLTVPSLEGDPIEDYSMKVAETWKVGQRGKDNGVILVVARDDRKVRIEVGGGLEGALPDITCGRIIRREIVPHFREGDYDAGVRDGTLAILGAIQGTYRPSEGTARRPGLKSWTLFFGIFLVVVGVFTFAAIFTPGRAGWFLYMFLIPFWLIFPMAALGFMAGGALFVGYLLGVPVVKAWFSRTEGGRRAFRRYQSARAARSSGGTWWVSSGGGSWGGSSGGFSGGGGSFSGGGASGSW